MMSSSTRSIPPNDVRGPSPKHRKFAQPSYGRHGRVKSESGSMARLSTLTVFVLAVTFPGVILSCFSFCIQSSISPKNQVATVRASHLGLSLSSEGSDNESFGSEDGEIKPETSAEEEGIDISLDSRLYKVRISRAPGIDWGTDLSFSFVYVRAMEPSGSAALSRQIQVGDQICELTAVTDNGEIGKPLNMIGAPFDFFMTSFAGLGKNVREVDLVFFRGTKQELKALCTGETTSTDPETITVTVIQNKGAEDETVRKLRAEPGVNVRQLLVDNGINVYQSLTRWTNCKGKQLCGTCIVDISAGSINTNRKSMDEGSTLRENPDSYRLSCVTFAYGDITVETFPAINAAQWTR